MFNELTAAQQNLILTMDPISVICEKTDIYMTEMIGDLPVWQKMDI